MIHLYIKDAQKSGEYISERLKILSKFDQQINWFILCSAEKEFMEQNLKDYGLFNLEKLILENIEKSLKESIGNNLYFNLFKNFKGKEDFLLIFISFLESLGFRQIMNVFRVVAYFNYVFGKSSWGIMKRKGFKSK